MFIVIHWLFSLFSLKLAGVYGHWSSWSDCDIIPIGFKIRIRKVNQPIIRQRFVFFTAAPLPFRWIHRFNFLFSIFSHERRKFLILFWRLRILWWGIHHILCILHVLKGVLFLIVALCLFGYLFIWVWGYLVLGFRFIWIKKFRLLLLDYLSLLLNLRVSVYLGGNHLRIWFFDYILLFVELQFLTLIYGNANFDHIGSWPPARLIF